LVDINLGSYEVYFKGDVYMSKLKQRKRLTVIGLVFLLVLLAGSAFAFLPGMLDVVGRVGIREGEYVRWILAATQGSSDRYVETAVTTDATDPGTDRIGFTHDLFSGDYDLAAALRAIHTPPTEAEISAIDSNVYLSHARIITDDTIRSRRSQRIEWSVVFQGPATATLYVQAMNFDENMSVTISNARIVGLTEFGPLAAIDTVTQTPADFHGVQVQSEFLNFLTTDDGPPVVTEDVFTVGGTAVTSLNVTLPPNVGPLGEALENPASSTGVETVTIEWSGLLPLVFDVLDRPLYAWSDTVVPDTDPSSFTYGQYIITGGEWVSTDTLREYLAATDPDAFAGMTDVDFFDDLMYNFDFFMTTSAADGTLYTFDALTPWIGTFILEFDYAITGV
jgi:hypothetical protein